MPTTERLNLVAPCGLDCGICELYTCRDDPRLLSFLVSKGIPQARLPCDGCRAVKGDCPVIGEVCETYSCAKAKGVDLCVDCDQFPCVRLQPAANMAEVLPHNMKMFNLCTIEALGKERFVEQSAEIKKRYYSGKMQIGRGPLG